MFKKTLFIFSLVAAFLLNPKFAFANTWQKETSNWGSDDFNLGYSDQYEVIERLSQTETIHIRFHLYKNLFALQVQSYRENVRDTISLASALQIATTDTNKRQDYIDKFNEEEKEIFTSYDAMINLANELSLNALNRSISFHSIIPFDVKAVQDAEPFQLYFLQILELEESLNFQIHSPELWIQHQAADLAGIVLCLDKEITAMQIKRVINDRNDLTLDHKEYNFYWSTIMNLCNKFLERLDNRWNNCKYSRLKILNLIFGQRSSFFFHYSEEVKNPIDLFFPYILKHADLDLARERFDQINHKLAPWDLSFEWVVLHIKAAEHLLPIDPEKAKTCFEKAKKLIDETLWCYFFSFNQENWNEKKEQALRVIEEHASFFE